MYRVTERTKLLSEFMHLKMKFRVLCVISISIGRLPHKPYNKSLWVLLGRRHILFNARRQETNKEDKPLHDISHNTDPNKLLQYEYNNCNLTIASNFPK